LLDSDLAQAIDQDHLALGALTRGDSEPKKRMLSQRDDVTLAKPLGPPVRGRDEVEKTLERVAFVTRDGEPHRFDRQE
jgi:hypothetical protein